MIYYLKARKEGPNYFWKRTKNNPLCLTAILLIFTLILLISFTPMDSFVETIIQFPLLLVSVPYLVYSLVKVEIDFFLKDMTYSLKFGLPGNYKLSTGFLKNIKTGIDKRSLVVRFQENKNQFVLYFSNEIEVYEFKKFLDGLKK